jgi:hypothetical protein
VVVHKIRLDGGGREPAGEYTFFYGKGNENHGLHTSFFVSTKIVSAVKKIGCVKDRVSYKVLTGPWCHITVMIIHPTTEDETL